MISVDRRDGPMPALWIGTAAEVENLNRQHTTGTAFLRFIQAAIGRSWANEARRLQPSPTASGHFQQRICSRFPDHVTSNPPLSGVRFDILIIHRRHGIVIFEVKAMGDAFTLSPDLHQSISAQHEVIRKKIGRSLQTAGQRGKGPEVFAERPLAGKPPSGHQRANPAEPREADGASCGEARS